MMSSVERTRSLGNARAHILLAFRSSITAQAAMSMAWATVAASPSSRPSGGWARTRSKNTEVAAVLHLRLEQHSIVRHSCNSPSAEPPVKGSRLTSRHALTSTTHVRPIDFSTVSICEVPRRLITVLASSTSVWSASVRRDGFSDILVFERHQVEHAAYLDSIGSQERGELPLAQEFAFVGLGD